jgi:translation initiation factor IF-2
MNKETKNLIRRPPVVAVMGHIDHGKSTLLDYIRKTNIVASEFGGITQHISAYEVVHKREDGSPQKITFLDTPGHAAFEAMRARGAAVADLAILVVSAEDGVKPQTIEAHRAITEAKIPYIVAINKIDKPNANIERTKQSLAENEIYVEGYGGEVPVVAISAKTGQNVSELLDMILLVADLEELTGDSNAPAEGVIIESSLDERRGAIATVVIKNGTLKSSLCAVAANSVSPLRMMEDFTGKKITEATFSSPVRIIGWSTTPPVGAILHTCDTKKEAESEASKHTDSKIPTPAMNFSDENNSFVIPLIIKTDVAGLSDAVILEIQKLSIERVHFKILRAEAGIISENDVKTATAFPGAIVLGFNVKVDPRADELAKRNNVEIKIYNVIYKLTEWLAEIASERRPKINEETTIGSLKVLKFFSEQKGTQVIGGKIISGVIKTGAQFRLLRRDEEVARGKIIEVQQHKSKVKEMSDGEGGLLVETKITIAPGDVIEAVEMVER